MRKGRIGRKKIISFQMGNVYYDDEDSFNSHRIVHILVHVLEI